MYKLEHKPAPVRVVVDGIQGFRPAAGLDADEGFRS